MGTKHNNQNNNNNNKATTTMKTCLLLLVCNVALLGRHHVASAAHLVLEGYALEQVEVDESPYTGTDGLVIHEGDHLHDPCKDHPGQRFTWSAGNGKSDQAKGFIVVNDCQVVECTKWNTDRQRGGRTGGKTVIYDLVEQAGNVEDWSILEPGQCSCGGDDNDNDADCYMGKFLVVDEYNGGNSESCDIAYSPGSIDCITGNFVTLPPPSSSSFWDDVISMGGRVSLGLAAGILLLLLCCCCYCFGCRRRRNRRGNKKDDSSESTDKSDEEAPAPRRASRKDTQAPVEGEAPAPSNKRGWGMAMFGIKKDKTAPSKSVDTAPQREQRRSKQTIKEEAIEPTRKKGWFFGKPKSSQRSEDAQVQEQQGPSSQRAIEEEATEPTRKKGWFFGKAKSTKNSEAMQVQEQQGPSSIRAIEEEATEPTKKKGWFFGKAKSTKNSEAMQVQEDSVEVTSVQATTTSWFSWRNSSPSVDTDQQTAIASNTESTRRWGFGKVPDDDATAAEKNTSTATKPKDTKKEEKKKEGGINYQVVEEETQAVDCTCCGA